MAEKVVNTALTNVNNTFMPMIERQLEGNGIHMDDYAKQCIINAISGIHTVLDKQGIAWQDPQLDKSNVTQVLLSIASLKLNAAASPRELYFIVRSVKTSLKDEHGKDIWKKQIEMGIEGDGNDAILARFGRDVKKIGQFWLVRSEDLFEYPQYVGMEMSPPKWTPTGKGDVVRVVYPIMKSDNSIEYYIAERADVAKNLAAHISNNMMNETFGLAESKYKATPEQKAKIDEKKAVLMAKAKDLGLGALDNAELLPYISPAWCEFQSRESMIIRKMRNNIVKKIPKDFGNAFVELTYTENSDESIAHANREISERANREVIDIDASQYTTDIGPQAANQEPDNSSPAQSASTGDSATPEKQKQQAQAQAQKKDTTPEQASGNRRGF